MKDKLAEREAELKEEAQVIAAEGVGWEAKDLFGFNFAFFPQVLVVVVGNGR